MTETGGILISLLPGLAMVPMKAGSNGFPIPGVDADVVDEKGDSVAPGREGRPGPEEPMAWHARPPHRDIRRPWRFEKTYYERFPGRDFFFCGDYAVKDKDGYIWVAGRADEVLKVAGHRLGTYKIESASSPIQRHQRRRSSASRTR